ncbi:MAG: hypothetical protein E5X49_21510, partial [Mesorhizobium sp.]
QGTLLSLQRAKSVTHLSGMNCHPSLGKDTSTCRTCKIAHFWRLVRYRYVRLDCLRASYEIRPHNSRPSSPADFTTSCRHSDLVPAPLAHPAVADRYALAPARLCP